MISFRSLLASWRRRAAKAAVGAAPLIDPRYLDRSIRYRNEATIRQLCDNVNLGPDRILCRVLGRYKMFVDPHDMGLSPHLALDGYWEMWLTEALTETVKRGMTVVDIGANLGYFTILMADLVGAPGRVHAFEPNARLVALMDGSVVMNGFHDRVTVHAQALADAETDVQLVVSDAEPKNGYLQPWHEGAAGEMLHTRRFDSYPELLTADVVKIDADTSEQVIWRGMTGLLSQSRPLTVFLEFAAVRYADAAGFLDEILQYGLSLAMLSLNDGIVPVSKAEVLAMREDIDVMLVLSR